MLATNRSEAAACATSAACSTTHAVASCKPQAVRPVLPATLKYVEHVTSGTCRGCKNLLRNSKWGAVECTSCGRRYCQVMLRKEILVCSQMREAFRASGQLCHCILSASGACTCQSCVKRKRRQALKREREAEASEGSDASSSSQQASPKRRTLASHYECPRRASANGSYNPAASRQYAPAPAMRVRVVLEDSASAGRVLTVPAECKRWPDFLLRVAAKLGIPAAHACQLSVFTEDGRCEYEACDELRDGDKLCIRRRVLASPMSRVVSTPAGGDHVMASSIVLPVPSIAAPRIAAGAGAGAGAGAALLLAHPLHDGSASFDLEVLGLSEAELAMTPREDGTVALPAVHDDALCDPCADEDDVLADLMLADFLDGDFDMYTVPSKPNRDRPPRLRSPPDKRVRVRGCALCLVRAQRWRRVPASLSKWAAARTVTMGSGDKAAAPAGRPADDVGALPAAARSLRPTASRRRARVRVCHGCVAALSRHTRGGATAALLVSRQRRSRQAVADRREVPVAGVDSCRAACGSAIGGRASW